MEGEGQLAFAAGEELDELSTLFKVGNCLPDLPSARHLIVNASRLVGGHNNFTLPKSQESTFHDVYNLHPKPKRRVHDNTDEAREMTKAINHAPE